MKRIVSICVLSLICVLTGDPGVQALEECPEGRLSLSDCIRISLANSDEIKIVEEKRRCAREEINEYRAAYWPSISFVAKALFETEEDCSYPCGIDAGWDIFDRGSRSFAVRRAAEDYLSSRWQERLICQEMIYHTASAYVRMARCRETYLLASEALSEEVRCLEIIRAKSGKGLVSGLDAVSVEAEVCQARIALSKWHSKLKRSKFSLNHAMGVNIDKPIEIEEMDHIRWSELVDRYKEIESCLEKVLLSRLDYKIAGCKLKANEANLGMVCVEAGPRITLDAGYYVDTQSGGESGDFSAGLVLDISLLDGGLRKAQIEKAKSQVNSARFQIERLKKAIREQVTDVHEGLRNLQDELYLQEKKLSLLFKSLEGEKSLYEAGVSDIGKLNDARQDYVSHRLKLSSLRYDILLSFLLLLKQIGKIEIITKDIQLTKP